MKIILNIILILNATAMALALYFFYCYVADPANELREELLIGVEMVVINSFPLWLSSTVLGIIKRKKISIYHFAFSQIPTCFMIISYLIATQI